MNNLCNLHLGMFSKNAINAIVSVLGNPFHGELLDTAEHRQGMRVYFQIGPSFTFLSRVDSITKEEYGEEMVHGIKVTDTSKP